jgi:hypothetical protein
MAAASSAPIYDCAPTACPAITAAASSATVYDCAPTACPAITAAASSATVYVCAPTACPATTTAAPGVTVYIRAPAACYHEYSLSSCKNEDNTATIMVLTTDPALELSYDNDSTQQQSMLVPSLQTPPMFLPHVALFHESVLVRKGPSYMQGVKKIDTSGPFYL